MTKSLHGRPLPDRELAKAIEASKAPAISRAAAILRLLGRSDAPLGLPHTARALGLVPSPCLYVLRALVAEELVAFDPDTKRYSLEAGVLTLARQWLRHNRFNDLAQPLLNKLGEEFGVTLAGAHIISLDHVVVVSVSQPAHDFQLSIQVGSRFPALISATGRCIAAFGGHPAKDLEARFKLLRWDVPPTFEDWNTQVAQTRYQGDAVDAGNYIAGVTVVAAPVGTSRAKLSHALVAIGIASGFERPGAEALPKALQTAAQSMSNQLSGGPPVGIGLGS